MDDEVTGLEWLGAVVAPRFVADGPGHIFLKYVSDIFTKRRNTLC